MKANRSSNQKIVFGSSTEMSEIADASVDLIFTSPPYWNLKEYGTAQDEIGHTSYETYLGDLGRVWKECYRVAKPGAVMIINVNSRRVKGRFYPIPYDIARVMTDWEFWDENIWYIPNALPQPNAYRERLLDNKYETLLVFIKGGQSSYKFKKPRVPQKYATLDPRDNKNTDGRCIGNIIRIPAYRPPNIRQMGYHVAAFPEELVAFFVESYTRIGDSVLDPFLGSGTTVKVASAMSRLGIGCEVNADFSELILKRINEPWNDPDWKNLDIIHSSTKEHSTLPARRIKADINSSPSLAFTK
jgi:DNA modification methylase